MAVVTRWFSGTAAGDGDGTSWANRAALLTGANVFSNIITGFDFTSDSLVCYIEGGKSYQYKNDVFTSGSFTVKAPSIKYHLTFYGCDSSGDPLVPPYGWVSSAGKYDVSGLPLIKFSGNACYLDGTYLRAMLVSFEHGRNSWFSSYSGITHAVFTCFKNVSNGTSSYACYDTRFLYGCIFESTGSFDHFIKAESSIVSAVENCLFIGAGNSGSGNRDGIKVTITGVLFNNTVYDCAGHGILFSPDYYGRGITMHNLTIANCGGSGVHLAYAAQEMSYIYTLSNSIITGCNKGVYSNNVIVFGNNLRLRDNTAGNTDLYAGSQLINVDTSTDSGATHAARDAAEFADPENGDYRIKATSLLWGKNLGAGDEIPTPEQIAEAVWTREGRELT